MKKSVPKTLEAIVTWLNPACDVARLKTLDIWENGLLYINLTVASCSVKPFIRGGLIGIAIGAAVSKATGLDMHQSIANGYVTGLGIDSLYLVASMAIDTLRTEYGKCNDTTNIRPN